MWHYNCLCTLKGSGLFYGHSLYRRRYESTVFRPSDLYFALTKVTGFIAEPLPIYSDESFMMIAILPVPFST